VTLSPEKIQLLIQIKQAIDDLIQAARDDGYNDRGPVPIMASRLYLEELILEAINE
jgi:hypothetical protein